MTVKYNVGESPDDQGADASKFVYVHPFFVTSFFFFISHTHNVWCITCVLLLSQTSFLIISALLTIQILSSITLLLSSLFKMLGPDIRSESFWPLFFNITNIDFRSSVWGRQSHIDVITALDLRISVLRSCLIFDLVFIVCRQQLLLLCLFKNAVMTLQLWLRT